MLDNAIPYYQPGLGNRLCYEITFNDYDRVIMSRTPLSPPKSPDTKYKITDVSLEYEIVTQQEWNTKAWFCHTTELSGTDRFQ